jgi:hypothetical protein
MMWKFNVMLGECCTCTRCPEFRSCSYFELPNLSDKCVWVNRSTILYHRLYYALLLCQ